MNDERANQFLSLIRRAQRGRHKIYLGYGPGVGKTTLMLQEAQRLKADRVDVVVGLVETHGRAGTAALVAGLEVLPRRITSYHGIAVEELDLEALLTRKPQVALVDELAHTNLPGSRNEKRWQDVQQLLAAGIHVISTVNIQHLESLYDTVERQIGVKVRERIPDAVLAEADQVVNVDLAPEDLQRRLELGQIYPQERIASALGSFFQSANLQQLRELTLRELAAQIDSRRREEQPGNHSGAPDQVMVCLSSRGPNSAQLLRFASRLAGRLNRTWYAVYVQTPGEDPLTIDAGTQRLLASTLTLANQLGAMVFTFKGDDVPQTIQRFAREYRVGHVVIGKPRPLPLWQRLLGRRTIAERLLYETTNLTIVVADAQARADVPVAAATPRFALGQLLDPALITICETPLTSVEVIRRLVELIAARTPGIAIDPSMARLIAREGQGSTFLNGGLALPHARLPGLIAPLVALALTRGGISDHAHEVPITLVLLILSPDDQPQAHLQLLAAAGRLGNDRELRRRLEAAADPQAVLDAIRHAAD